ncbi:universal stress protein [Phenylobacterium sp. LjRoot219]|uniref:universal stress protein n=1 Tax=Phenylobacterium sp. LjRoot219 TaxID=3342283 RepID=UPI003ECCA8DD
MNWPATPPKKILFATDLTGLSDRALDRAAQLANAWGAELLVVHAIEGPGLGLPDHDALPSWRRAPPTASFLEQQIKDDVRGLCPRFEVHVERGPAVKVVLDAVEREMCDLVVLGVGRHRPLGGLGRTIEELFRRSPVSVLVAKRRANGPYRHVLVGTDFSEEARYGLEAAMALFPEASFALMHAYEMPYRALLSDSQLGRDFGQMEKDTIRTFLDGASLPDAKRAQIEVLIEHGPPEAMLGTYVLERGADLTVIGAYERSRLFHLVIRGKGPRIVESTPSDVLVVRAERPIEQD